MKLSLSRSIIATLVYADIFSQPLTSSEIWFWLQGKAVSKSRVIKQLRILSGKKIKSSQKSLYYLSGREEIITGRIQKQKDSDQKWKIAQRVGLILKIIPTIKLIGVTGGVSVNNANLNDDIDLFFITQAGTLWSSRLWSTILVELFFRRRHPNEEEVKNSICLNMFLTKNNLKIPTVEQDIYIAHEVLQMQPLWERGNIYHQFLSVNSWVERYLPNAYKFKMYNAQCAIKKTNQEKSSRIIYFFEPLARKIQLWYMRKHRTTEIVSDNVLRFHPNDMRGQIKIAYNNRLNKYNIPLDNQF
jgi:hypothetical protein